MRSNSTPAWGWKTALLTGCLVLGGCATQQPLYYWGQYPQQVYRDLSEDGSVDERIASLEKIQEEAQGRTAALPPGFRAHLGLLYAQAGRQDAAHQQWQAESQAFPESSQFMAFLQRGGRQATPEPAQAATGSASEPTDTPAQGVGPTVSPAPADGLRPAADAATARTAATRSVTGRAPASADAASAAPVSSSLRKAP